MADDEHAGHDHGDHDHAGHDHEGPGEIDLAQVRVEGLMLQVASELMSIGAGQLGLIPEMVNGGDAFQASLAIGGADALVETFVAALPPGTELPEPVAELRGALAELKLAFADAVRMAQEAAEGGEPHGQPEPAAEPAPERPAIWTPGGDA